MVDEQEILELFRKKLPEQATLTFKSISLKMDDVLQEYCDSDDLIYAINEIVDCINIDASSLNLDNYFPWHSAWFFRKWFTNKPVRQISKPLTVKMFVESAKAGRWLYD
ncbi:DUF1493 family protein [Kalamiella sp. sgz302252]|uniref:DUF1493 family protein n=1 Tax=Pantoea sp. sgz302252 TaxID=3341827 RepID=UPI0036D21E65